MKKHQIWWIAFFFLIALSGGAVFCAHAAPLNFSTAESITLSSYPTTLTIGTSSVADALTANATSVLVTLSQTTGGSFTLLSLSYDLSVATSTGGGSATVSCSGGIETATLSQTTGLAVYTVTPTTQHCANASAPIIAVSPTSTNVTVNSATITWTTNIAADSTASYGTTPSYGATSTDPSFVTAHSTSLTGLSTSTLYHYAVTSAENGTSTTSGDYSFTTASGIENSAAVPTFSPVTGTYYGTQSVTISCATPASTIYYTIDGTTPTISSAAYATPIGVSSSETVSAICTATGYSTSAVASSNYVIQAVVSSVPTSTQSGGSTAYDLSVNSGALSTATTSVTLSLYGTGAYTMEVSNTSTFVGATWISYTTTLPWILAPSAGDQTVYVQFQSVRGMIVGTAQASIDLTAPPASLTSSTSSLTAEIASLRAQLAVLLAEANGTTISTTPFVFTRNLYFGITGNDVKQLQQFLISQGSGPAAQKLKVHGTTTYFGVLTQNALIEFQRKVGITPAIGYFGPITRKYVNNLIP
jgi:hypothetical protein